ncbi:MAG: 50S ribosomal protein L6 [bacterium]
MAKIYRPLTIPDGVEVKVGVDRVTVKGKLGSLDLLLYPGVVAKVVDRQIVVEGNEDVERKFIGTMRALIRNMLVGVSSGYQKIVELRGMGYRVQKTKTGVQFNCGFSHPVDFSLPEGISVEVKQLPNPEDTKEQMFEIVVSGIDKQLVGNTAAHIRAIKIADPYHGKGFRYRNEKVRKKAGKRAVGAQG